MAEPSADDVPALHAELASLRAELALAHSDLEGFAHVVSHDLRGPLAVVLGFASLIKERESIPAGDAARGYLDEILRAGARIDALIAALVLYARNSQAPLAREQVPISELVRKVWRELGQGSDKAQRAVIHIERLAPVSADPALLETVLRSLLDNALRFADAHDPQLRFGRAPGDASEVFFVQDNGPGFDPRHAQRLFLPFQRLTPNADAAERGAGVGLATCARIVRRHGGRIWAENHTERGARFFFTLSAAGPQVAAASRRT